jgi:hypothetical protein
MSTDYSPLEAALEKLSIYDVWQLLGLEGKPGRSCRSPVRQDKHPSFSIYKQGRRWKDHGTGEGGDAADFCAYVRRLSREDGRRLLIELAGTRRPQDQKSANTSAKATNREPYDPLKDQEKAGQRQTWPAFEIPASAEIKTIARLRGLSPEGVSLAAERGLLFCAQYSPSPHNDDSHPAWIVTDSKRVNAQARRLDGRPWKHNGDDKKALTLPGSVGAWPIGLPEALSFPNVALVEGGPDLLAAFHLAWCATATPETLALEKGVDVVGKLGVIAMMGTPPILESVLPRFAGKRVRIFADADEPGLEAEGCWWHQLESAGAKVDGWDLKGFIRSDGTPVKDLNDFALIDSDQWEAQRDAIERAFAFQD